MLSTDSPSEGCLGQSWQEHPPVLLTGPELFPLADAPLFERGWDVGDRNKKGRLWVSEASTWGWRVLGEICAFVWTLGLSPEQFSCPSPRRAGLFPGSGLPWAATGARHQEQVQMPGQSLGLTSGGESCPGHQPQPGGMFLGRS